MNEGLGLTDRLTGLKNYECFTAEFGEMIIASQEKMEDISLAMVDIDRFSSINKEYGHETGDEVIRAVADHLIKSTPEYAQIYRYSGDEFAVLLPNTEKEKVFLIMEKLRESFRFQGKVKDNQPHVSLSIGISSSPEDGGRITEIVRKAEGALFRAKKAGRNKVCLSREEKMITKTSHYTYEQLQRLSELARKEGLGEAVLLREALDDLLKKYDY